MPKSGQDLPRPDRRRSRFVVLRDPGAGPKRAQGEGAARRLPHRRARHAGCPRTRRRRCSRCGKCSVHGGAVVALLAGHSPARPRAHPARLCRSCEDPPDPRLRPDPADGTGASRPATPFRRPGSAAQSVRQGAVAVHRAAGPRHLAGSTQRGDPRRSDRHEPGMPVASPAHSASPCPGLDSEPGPVIAGGGQAFAVRAGPPSPPHRCGR